MSGRAKVLLATAAVFAAHVLFYALVPPIGLGADALQYEQMARNLAAGHGYTLEGQPVTTVMPGYSLFVAGLYLIFGAHPWLVRIVQAAMVAISALGIMVVARRQLGPRAGLVAFATVALLPGFFVYPGTLNAEILLLTMQVVFLLWLLREPGRPWIYGAVGGALTAAVALIKPEFFVWLPAATIFWLTGRRRRWPVVAATSLVAYLLVMAPWVARNYVTFHKLIPFSTRSGQALWLSGHKPELLEFKEAPYREALARCKVPGDPKGTDDCLMAEAKKMVASHPVYFLETSVKRVGRSLFGSHTDFLRGYSASFVESWRKRDLRVFAVKLVLLGIQTVFVLVGLAGIVWLCRERRHWVIAYLVASNLAVHAVLFGSPRYGLHLTPLLALGWGGLALAIGRRR